MFMVNKDYHYFPYFCYFLAIMPIAGRFGAARHGTRCTPK